MLRFTEDAIASQQAQQQGQQGGTQRRDVHLEDESQNAGNDRSSKSGKNGCIGFQLKRSIEADKVGKDTKLASMN